MPPRPPFARIAITLPAADLAAADRLATEQDRSRSWIVAEAVRQFVAAMDSSAARRDIGSFRRAQLERDLLLSPEQRVAVAEEAQLRSAAGVGLPRVFGSYDEFQVWLRANGELST